MSFLPRFLTGRPKEGFKPQSWAEIATPEQFKNHAKTQLGGSEHVRLQEKEYLELATAQHASSTKTKTPCWEEADLDKFLASRLPSELHPDLQAARPLLYRCLARMSSYPYLDDPKPPQGLTVDDMLAALSLILMRPSWLGRPDPMATVDATVAEKHARNFRALLFRSMRVLPPQHLVEEKGAHDGHGAATPRGTRTEQDDDDLRQVHSLITSSRRYRSERFPTVMKSGPPIIALQHLPSSNSTDLKGFVPRNEFEALFRVCSCLESGKWDVAPPQREDSRLSSEVDWEEFDTIIASAPVVNVDRLPVHLVSEIGNQSSFIRGMTLLFSLFISPAGISNTGEEQEASKEQIT